MKTLILLRHGKSSWDDPVPDHDRHLAKRGRRDAERAGRFLAEEGLEPEWLWSSTAARAAQTASILAEAAEWDVDPAFSEALYGATDGEILDVVATTPDWADIVMVVGHNPGMEEAASELVRELCSLRTCEMAVVRLPIETWSELAAAPHGRLEAIWRGADLGARSPSKGGDDSPDTPA
jgi:phosphohistidine phosphatase